MTTTTQAVMNVVNWLQEDWTHVIIAACVVRMFIPTPKPGTFAARLCNALDVLALNVLHAKPGSSSTVAIAEQVASIIESRRIPTLTEVVPPVVVPPVVVPANPVKEKS